jgi:methylmalonyl-CoA/ethylmalonyl-CoA epimerase
LHHVCYEIDDLESALQHARSVNMAIAAPPLPAVAFHDRRIAWVCSRTRLLIELLERSRE